MEEKVSKLPITLQRILKNEDSILGNIVVWHLCLTVFPTGGFYLGTIASPSSNVTEPDGSVIRHFWDLHVSDIHFGGYGALVGLAIGLCFGLWITFRYPRIKELDAIEDAETQERIHALSGHHHGG
jgi:hypothetical protein